MCQIFRFDSNGQNNLLLISSEVEMLRNFRNILDSLKRIYSLLYFCLKGWDKFKNNRDQGRNPTRHLLYEPGPIIFTGYLGLMTK